MTNLMFFVGDYSVVFVDRIGGFVAGPGSIASSDKFGGIVLF